MADDIRKGKDITKGSDHSFLQTVWVTLEYLAVHFFDGLVDNLRIMREELNLFLGASFFLLGFFNWSSSKYCDGNTADYLSCTRPTAYYYYGGFEIALMLVGALLILTWYVKNRKLH